MQKARILMCQIVLKILIVEQMNVSFMCVTSCCF